MGDAVDFQYYQYTADDGSTWSVKVDKTWGDDADAGFGPPSSTDPVMVRSPALRPRQITLQDLTSTRITTRVVGDPTATAWTTAGYTTTINFRGLAAGVVATKIDQRGEHIRRRRAIDNKPEPV